MQPSTSSPLSGTALSASQVIEQMQRLVPPGSPPPQDSAILSQLSGLTQDLIRAYQSSGRLAEDPFYDAWTRPLYLYESEIRSLLAGKTALVTGGEGCVGAHLIDKLVALGAQRVVSVDHLRCDTDSAMPLPGAHPNVQLYAADIRDRAALDAIFTAEQPQLVFHAAAQRQPGLAEKQVRATITSNVFGTQNVIQLCETFGVEQCIFSSTGKASRYFTAEIYAASKKMAEWLFAQAVQTGRVRYGMVRFTHMLDNSLMNEQITAKVNEGILVNVHAPDRYVAGQNVGEAVHLMLNALVLSDPTAMRFLLVRNLGWPTESLEVALYKIMQSGRPTPIYFQGVQPGYEEAFFLGQVDWDDQLDINTLINALETSYNTRITQSQDMIDGELVPFDAAVASTQLAMLQVLCDRPDSTEAELKQGLANAVREIARTNFLLAAPELVLRILRWGVDPKKFARGELKLEGYRDIITLLVQCLAPRFTVDVVAKSQLDPAEVDQLLTVLATLPHLDSEIAVMKMVICNTVAPPPSVLKV
jgi:nucleoside-diphosphate-sugar epimerase